MTILSDKRLLLTGVVTTDSIAWATAARALELGAEVVLSAPPRDLDRAREAAGELPTVPRWWRPTSPSRPTSSG